MLVHETLLKGNQAPYHFDQPGLVLPIIILYVLFFFYITLKVMSEMYEIKKPNKDAWMPMMNDGL